MAGRIPQDFIDDLLNRTDIADVIEERISLKRTGRNYSALCPFHKEKSPSFSVNPEKQFYYCFGCGAAGNAIGFVMEYDRMDFPQAVETLARRAGMEVPKQEADNRVEKKLHGTYQILADSAEFYQQQLRHHPDSQKAVDYLKGRGLSGQIAKRFGIGYAPPGWDNLIKFLETKSQSDKTPAPTPEKLDEAGMVINKVDDNKCYDRFRDRIMFPIIDMRGRVIAFGGRVLTDEKPKYLNSPETSVFHKSRELYGLYQARQANRQLDRILIVEGYMDVVALAQYDINNAVATLGTATSEHHLTRLFKIVPNIVFCFDGDSAGRKAAQRALETALPLMEDGRQAHFLFLPEGDDPDSIVRNEGTEGFHRRVNQATPLSQFFFDSYAEGLDLQTDEGRARFSALVMPQIKKIPGSFFQQLLQEKLATTTGLKSEFIQQFNEPVELPEQASSQPVYEHNSRSSANYQAAQNRPAYQHPNQPRYNRQVARPNTVIKPSSVALRALKILLHAPQLATTISLEMTDLLNELSTPELLLLNALIEQLRQQPDRPTALILLDWQDNPNYQVLHHLVEQELLVANTSELHNELNDCLQQLLKLNEEAKIDDLKNKGSAALTVEEKQLLVKLLSRQ